MAHKRFTRREFLRTLAVAGASGAAFSLASCTKAEREQFFQKHFLEMTEAEKEADDQEAGGGLPGEVRTDIQCEQPRGDSPTPYGGTALTFRAVSGAGDASMPV